MLAHCFCELKVVVLLAAPSSRMKPVNPEGMLKLRVTGPVVPLLTVIFWGREHLVWPVIRRPWLGRLTVWLSTAAANNSARTNLHVLIICLLGLLVIGSPVLKRLPLKNPLANRWRSVTQTSSNINWFGSKQVQLLDGRI